MSDDHRNAPGERLPWSFVLDPAANAKALGDVQRRGLEAAHELVERVASTIAPSEAGSGPGHANGSTDPATGQGPPIADLVQDWWEVAGRVLAELAAGTSSSGGPLSPDGPVEVDVHAADRPTVWRVRSDPSGRLIVPGELWLRNRQPHPVGPLSLGVGDLRAPDGAVISAHCLRFDPPELAELPARTARGVVVTLSPERPFEPGIYRGVVQAAGAPNLLITLEVTVPGGSSS